MSGGYLFQRAIYLVKKWIVLESPVQSNTSAYRNSIENESEPKLASASHHTTGWCTYASGYLNDLSQQQRIY